jgi:hypothetical protein
METIYQMIHEEPQPLLALDPTIGEDLNAICMKALEKSPAQRYANALEMAEDLRRYLRNEPVLARASTVTERLMKAVRRNRDIALISGIALTFMAVTLSCSLMLFARESGANVRTALQTELKSIANTAAMMFSSADLDQIRSRGDEKKEVFRNIVLLMNEIRRRNPKVDEVYILRKGPSPGSLLFVADADAFAQHSGSGAFHPGRPWPMAAGSSAPAGFHRAVADDGLLETPSGKRWSGYAPIFDANSRAVAILGLDVSAQRLYTAMQPALRTTVQVGGLATFLFLGFTAIAGARLLRKKKRPKA